MSATQARADFIQALGIARPDIAWISGRLPAYFRDAANTVGAVSTANSVEASNGQYVVHTIAVQVYGAVPVVNPENITIEQQAVADADPAIIEGIVDNVMAALATIRVDGGQGHYWEVLPQRVDYPPDANQQQTRAEMQFSVQDNPFWQPAGATSG
jgi:hypothetical protein